jgi:hypothetical protein
MTYHLVHPKDSVPLSTPDAIYGSSPQGAPPSRTNDDVGKGHESQRVRIGARDGATHRLRPRRVSSMTTSIPGARDGAAQPNVGWNGPSGTYEIAAGPKRREVRLGSWRRCTGTADDGAVSVCTAGHEHCLTGYQPRMPAPHRFSSTSATTHRPPTDTRPLSFLQRRSWMAAFPRRSRQSGGRRHGSVG